MDVRNDEAISQERTVDMMGAGIVGSLSYAFSDSFWFSAVEAEVYAMSSFFTALVVWLMLKWDVVEDEAKANRWLILLAYMIGVSMQRFRSVVPCCYLSTTSLFQGFLVSRDPSKFSLSTPSVCHSALVPS